LVVEDDVIIARSICTCLEKEGYVVLGPVSRSADAIAMANKHQPDLILMDINLDDELDGIQAAIEINTHLDVPVIYITAQTDSETIMRARKTKPYGFIYKPIGENETIVCIELALDRHKMQLELNRNERLLATTLNSIEHSVVSADSEMRITYVNPVTEKILGIPASDILGKSIESVFRFYRENDTGELKPDYQALLDTGERQYLPDDSLLKNAQGEYTPVIGTFSAVADPNGYNSGVVIVLRDVTRKRKEAEKSRLREHLGGIRDKIRVRLLKESKPDFKEILGLFAGAVGADRAYICLFPAENSMEISKWETVVWSGEQAEKSGNVLNSVEDMFGDWWKRQIAAGRKISYADIGEMPDEAQPEKAHFREYGVKSVAAFPFRSKKSGNFDFIGLEWIGEGYTCSETEVRMLTILSEIIASNIVRVKAEEMVRSSEGRFRALIQNSSDVIVVLSPDRNFLFLSPSATKILGYEPEELIGKNAFQLIHREDLPGIEEVFLKILEHPKEDMVFEHRFLHKQGHWVYLESVGTNLLNDPDVGGVVVNSRDITDRKRVEKELIRARDTAEEMNRVKTALLANISHEMRTPLTGIMGFASILESDLSDGEARDMAVRIHVSGRRLLETIESILDLAKLESDRVDIQVENVNLIDELHRAMEVHKRSARHKGLAFSLQTDVTDLFMDIDRQLFNRIMFNLLSNAFKYTEQGEVVVYVSKIKKKNQPWVQIDVQDTGVGISADFLPRVFEEFQQESTGLSRKFEGSGLGLTITRKLVDVLEGNITANSKKGEGSIFTIQLPVRDEHAHPQTSGSKPYFEQALPQKPHILVVEDDFDSSVIVKFYLGQEYDVDTVDSGEKALEKMQEEKYQMVILDISLGAGMDGVATLKAIRSNRRWVEIPVIALTAHALGGDAEFYLEQGFSEYLAKPFKKDELLSVVGKLLKKR